MLVFNPLSKASVVVFALALCQGCGLHMFSSAGDYVRRATALMAQGKYEEADLQYRKALQKDDRSGEAHLRYGQFLARRNKLQDAYTHISRAAELMPRSEEAHAELGRFSIRIFLGDPQRPAFLYQSAKKESAALLSMNPNSFEGLRLRGYIAMADAQPKAAIENFQRANGIKPNQPDIVTVLMENLLADNRPQEAENLGRQSLESIRNYGPLYDALYGLYMASDRTEQAEQLLRTKIARNPRESFYVVQLADYYRGRKNVQRMNDAIDSLAANARNYSDAFLRAGDFYRRIGEPNRALAMYRKGIATGGSQKEQCLQSSVALYLSQGRNEEAAGALDQILKDNPNDSTAIASRADLRLATGKPEETRQAIANLSRAVAAKPNDKQIRFGLATAYRQSGDLNAARAGLQEILVRDPNDRNALRELADLAIRRHQPDEALQYAERLIRIDPNELNVRLIRTSAWAQLGLFGKVRPELKTLTAAAPDLPEPWIQMAALDLEEKQYDDAERIFRRFYKPGNTDIRAIRGLIGVLQARGQADKGLILARAEAERSNGVEVRNLLATSAAQAGNLDLALATIQKLASDFPQNPDNLLFAGDIYQKKGQMDQAIASFRKARQVAPADPLPAAHLGDALGRAGRYPEAVAAYRGSVKLRPGDALLMNNLAWYLAQAGDLEEAGKWAQQAVQKQPSNPLFTDTLAMVDLKLKRFGAAQDLLQGLASRAPNNPEYRMHLAMVMLGSGQREKAKVELEIALRSRPAAEREREIGKLLARPQ